jgi:hypothetical protein
MQDLVLCKVQGFVKDVNGATVATLMGKWDQNMYCSTTATGPNAKATAVGEK